MRALQLAALALLVATTSTSVAQDGGYCPTCNGGSCGSSKGGFLNCGNWFKKRKNANCESCQASQGYAAAPYAGEAYTGNQYPGGYADDPNGPGLGPNGSDGGAYGPAGYGGPAGGPAGGGYGGATRYPVRGTPGYPHHHYAREYQGPQGPSTAQVAYPYYTTRGPRDFLMNNPPSIGQ